jgi:hypothetical protein
MKSVWQREIERAAESYRKDAESRRRLSRHDPVADALEYVASDLEERARILADPTATSMARRSKNSEPSPRGTRF